MDSLKQKNRESKTPNRWHWHQQHQNYWAICRIQVRPERIVLKCSAFCTADRSLHYLITVDQALSIMSACVLQSTDCLGVELYLTRIQIPLETSPTIMFVRSYGQIGPTSGKLRKSVNWETEKWKMRDVTTLYYVRSNKLHRRSTKAWKRLRSVYHHALSSKLVLAIA